MALDDHDQRRGHRGRRHQLRRPPQRHDGELADAAKSVQVGFELFRDIEDRWNRGAFGREYDECDDVQQRRRWDTGAGLGRKKIFEVRRIHNDLTFIDEFLTLDFVRDHKLFRFGYNPGSEAYEIESREFPKVKQQLLQMSYQSRAADHRRRRRQLPQPRGALPSA